MVRQRANSVDLNITVVYMPTFVHEDHRLINYINTKKSNKMPNKEFNILMEDMNAAIEELREKM